MRWGLASREETATETDQLMLLPLLQPDSQSTGLQPRTIALGDASQDGEAASTVALTVFAAQTDASPLETRFNLGSAILPMRH